MRTQGEQANSTHTGPTFVWGDLADHDTTVPLYHVECYLNVCWVAKAMKL